MQDTPILTTKKPIIRAICYLLVGMVLGCISCVFAADAFSDQGGGTDIFIALVFGLPAFYILVYAKLDTLVLYEDRLEVFSFFGFHTKTIPFSTITSWGQYPLKNHDLLTIFTTQGRYRISSSRYKDYAVIKNKMIAGKPLTKVSNPYKYPVIFFALCTLLAGSCFLIEAIQYGAKDKVVRPAAITTVNGAITNAPDVTHTETTYRGRTSIESYVNIVLSNFPKAIFRIDNDAYQAMNQHDYVTNVHTGDSLHIDVLTTDYNAMVNAGGVPVPVANDGNPEVDSPFIYVYGLRDAHMSYLALADVNKTNKMDSRFYIPLILGLVFLLFSVLFFYSAFHKA